MRGHKMRVLRLKSGTKKEPVAPIPIARMRLVRLATPLFLGAAFLYVAILVVAYPKLLAESQRTRKDVAGGDVMSDNRVTSVEESGIPRRKSRALEAPPTRRGKTTIIDRVLQKGQRAAQVYGVPVDDPSVDQPVDVGLNDHVRGRDQPLVNGNVPVVVADSMDKLVDGHQGHPQMKESEEQEDAAGKKMPYYNKLITVPKSERYIDEPIDSHQYGYIHRPDVCRTRDGVHLRTQLIFMVTTAPRNTERRNLIRDTYGNKRNWPLLHTGGFRLIFLLGAVSDIDLQRDIDDEFAAHGDILQEDFVDSYANLTLKTVMGLKWVTNYCRQAVFTMKIDDDSMIHQNRLLRMLKNATTANFTAAEALINSPVLRNTSSKYYISERYFPAPTYPPYLNGPGYLISTDLAEGLYRVATSTPLFPWEDVFLGLCLKQLDVVPVVRHDFMLIIAKFSQISDKVEAVKLFKYYTVVSNLEPEYMRLMWDACRFRFKRTESP